LNLVVFTDRDLGTRFPDILAAAGLNVERHRDHFPPDCADVDWLSTIGSRGWIAVSHDQSIRTNRTSSPAVVRHRVTLLVVVGKVPFPQLARHFVATIPRITNSRNPRRR
jgi:hypothetical protein